MWKPLKAHTAQQQRAAHQGHVRFRDKVSQRSFDLYIVKPPRVEHAGITGIGVMICAIESDEAWILPLEAVLEEFVPPTPDATRSEGCEHDGSETTAARTVERLMLGRSA